jgi:hypothetical protein
MSPSLATNLTPFLNLLCSLTSHFFTAHFNSADLFSSHVRTSRISEFFLHYLALLSKFFILVKTDAVSSLCDNVYMGNCTSEFLRTKCNHSFKDPVRTAQKTSIWVIKTDQLMLNRPKFAVCSEIHTKHRARGGAVR